MPNRKFEQSAIAITTEVGQILSRLVGSFGCTKTTPTEIQRATNLNLKLSWKIAHLINNNGASKLAETIHIPGPSNQKTLLKLARKQEVPEGLRDELSDAFNRFEEHVRVEAGNRRSYDAIISASGGGNVGNLLDQRRNAFRANRHIWGLEADLQLKTVIAGIAKDDPDRLDLATISLGQGIRLIRPTETPLFMMLSGIVNEDGTSRPMDAEHPWVMREFTSPEIPDLEYNSIGSEWQVSVPAGGVGLRNSKTVTVGVHFPSCTPRYAVPAVPAVGPTTGVHFPTPLLVLDCLVDQRIFKDTTGSRTCRANFYADRLGSGLRADAPETRETNVVMKDVPVSTLGNGLSAAHLVEVPQYSAMLSEVFDRLDADPANFSVFRVRVDYPILLSSGRLEVDLPPEA